MSECRSLTTTDAAGGKRPEGDTLPLHISAIFQAADVLELLLDRGEDVNARDERRGG